MPGDLLKASTANLVVDGREMQPPEPLEKTLEALDKLQPNEELLLLVYCHPVPLFNILRNNGYVWQEDVREDGTHEIRIRQA
jgi:TusA-related sulfurtransferase